MQSNIKIYQEDIKYLKQALDQAKIRRGFCAPNPAVGAVIVRDGIILAAGYHFASGSDHAEVDALKKINHQAKGATIYITLEPCCHFGKTPPCTEALINSGITRVVYGYQDPNPIVSGKSKSILQTAGIISEYIISPEINDFYASYYHWCATQTPFVTAKIALSLDGKIAGKNGECMQLTGAVLQAQTHQFRKNSDAILTTSKTILKDNPQLNIRIGHDTISKPIYILDTQLNLPLDAKIINTAKSLTVFYSSQADPNRLSKLINLNIRCIPMNINNKNKLDLQEIISFIGKKDGIHDLWVEAGGQCFSSFVKQKLLQRAYIYIAPRILGEDALSAFDSEITFPQEKITWQQYDQDVMCDILW